MNNCQHLHKIGDNYGMSCAVCGEKIQGYGYGGWFGHNLTGDSTCIHLWSPIGDSGKSICIYCEEMKDNEATS